MTIGRQGAAAARARALRSDFSFSFINTDGTLRSVRGKFDGDKFDGWMRLDGYDTPVSGRRSAKPAPAKS